MYELWLSATKQWKAMIKSWDSAELSTMFESSLTNIENDLMAYLYFRRVVNSFPDECTEHV